MVREGDAGAEFELRLVEPPVLSMVASLGGSVEAAVVEDGDYQLTLQLPPTVDVRRVSERVESAYPTAELLTRRQVTRAVDTVERTDRVLSESLTDRQRAALLAAYHAGFFEWPREASGEDVAESLGVSAPTFHQHLRKAERKVLDSLLSRVG
jgi:predicted DNA binding protein